MVSPSHIDLNSECGTTTIRQTNKLETKVKSVYIYIYYPLYNSDMRVIHGSSKLYTNQPHTKTCREGTQRDTVKTWSALSIYGLLFQISLCQKRPVTCVRVLQNKKDSTSTSSGFYLLQDDCSHTMCRKFQNGLAQSCLEVYKTSQKVTKALPQVLFIVLPQTLQMRCSPFPTNLANMGTNQRPFQVSHPV